jgi:uncharacterized protein (TIGR03032 family)
VPGSQPTKTSETTPPLTAVDFEHTGNLVALLQQLGISLLISTYQAGKVVSVGSTPTGLQIRFHHFEQAMGLARLPTGIAVVARRQIWTLNAAPDLARRLPPAGSHDICFLTRQAHFTGPIMGHDLAWCGDELWVVNTLFSCLCVLHPVYSFVPRWRPPFVSALVSEDRCHLNGMATDERQPRYVTALGETDTAAGWRPNKATGGCLIEVASGDVLLRGLSMPHSPRLHNGRLWLLDSGYGRLGRYDEQTQRLEVVCELPGYTRGMDCFGRLAFIGLSRIRETSVFGGLPIAERRATLRCGLAVVDLDSAKVLATLLFHSGVEEIFDVKVLPGYRNPVLSGPYPDVDRTETLWLVPPLPAGDAIRH